MVRTSKKAMKALRLQELREKQDQVAHEEQHEVTESQQQSRDCRWVLICRSDLRALELVARKPTDPFDRKLRGRLKLASIRKPGDNSLRIRSGECVAIPADPAVLAAILGEDPRKRRIAAAALAADAGERWAQRGVRQICR